MKYLFIGCIAMLLTGCNNFYNAKYKVLANKTCEPHGGVYAYKNIVNSTTYCNDGTKYRLSHNDIEKVTGPEVTKILTQNKD